MLTATQHLALCSRCRLPRHCQKQL